MRQRARCCCRRARARLMRNAKRHARAASYARGSVRAQLHSLRRAARVQRRAAR
jgi:hypothetical protein